MLKRGDIVREYKRSDDSWVSTYFITGVTYDGLVCQCYCIHDEAFDSRRDLIGNCTIPTRHITEGTLFNYWKKHE